MKNTYDVIVIGLGIMGAAALWRVAAKCDRALGIDASGPTHCYGSSQGSSRIFRRAYWEGNKYLPLLQHADLLWQELEHLLQKQIIFRTRGIFIGPQSSRVVAGSIETARQGRIEHEIWTPSETKNVFPAFSIPEGMQTVHEPGAYAISAQVARLGMLDEALRRGATTEFGNTVVDIKNQGAEVLVTTRNSRSYRARAVVVTTGPWIASELMPELYGLLEPRRVPIYWFKPKIDSEKLFSRKRFPVFLYECPNGSILYGMPSIASDEPGVKIGFHNRQQSFARPDWKSFAVQDSSVKEITEAVEALFPKLERSPIKEKNCFYTMSPDESFLIGKSEALKSTYFASACSGHGFKFAPAIGDALANVAVGQQPFVSLSSFSAHRFNSTSRVF
ncbi:N-methyl-L-tryptophan oxidase [Pseudomonas palleroniana]|uniref:N-methyl-L-tryptophan oxidase n=1 Tax=Pseudomonas palleroniana TaxID=191390 RepID=A0A1H5NQ87_9PSED|nr:N-methyl-L-tryptophan oxidase [Pseudomonas palleroniana]KAB0570283.1 N-methyl-L-tryptophan oxidase [Pseudomonas palleroniana]PTC30432.1 N-methyl-L-tryptophan oxidase [Pseudomonas palleroniana]SEF03650.1 sarcosine oxidase [Pseudomonas palleroniana]